MAGEAGSGRGGGGGILHVCGRAKTGEGNSLLEDVDALPRPSFLRERLLRRTPEKGKQRRGRTTTPMTLARRAQRRLQRCEKMATDEEEEESN